MTKKLSFKILCYLSEGEIGVSINGVKYTYNLDAGFIPKIVKMAKCKPGKALNFLKEVAFTCEKIKQKGN